MNSVPGSNLIKKAFKVIKKQSFIYKEFLSRTANAKGILVPTFKDGVTYNWYIGKTTTGGDGTAVINTGTWDGVYLTTVKVNAAGQSVDCKLNPKYGGRASITI